MWRLPTRRPVGRVAPAALPVGQQRLGQIDRRCISSPSLRLASPDRLSSLTSLLLFAWPGLSAARLLCSSVLTSLVRWASSTATRATTAVARFALVRPDVPRFVSAAARTSRCLAPASPAAKAPASQTSACATSCSSTLLTSRPMSFFPCQFPPTNIPDPRLSPVDPLAEKTLLLLDRGWL